MFKKSIQLLSILIIVIFLFSTCQSTVDIDETDFEVIRVNVQPTDRINQVVDCWKLYYDDTTKAFEARKALLEIMNPHIVSSSDIKSDNELIKAEQKETLKHTFEEIKTTHSEAGVMFIDGKDTIPIFLIDLEVDFGKLTYKESTTWILNNMNYSIRYRDNFRLKDNLNINYYINEENKLENSFSIGFGISNLTFQNNSWNIPLGLKGNYFVEEGDLLKGRFYPIHLMELIKEVFKGAYGSDSKIISYYEGDLFTKSDKIQVIEWK